jgi:hypothetical protein
MVLEVIPARPFVVRFVCPTVPDFTHREGLWSGPALMEMLCGIIKNHLRRNP